MIIQVCASLRRDRPTHARQKLKQQIAMNLRRFARCKLPTNLPFGKNVRLCFSC
jgi:hypothetical protein